MALPFREALHRLEDSRVKATRPLIPPQILQEDLPLYVHIFTPVCKTEWPDFHLLARTLSAAQAVIEGRRATENILRSNDDRLLVVVG